MKIGKIILVLSFHNAGSGEFGSDKGMREQVTQARHGRGAAAVRERRQTQVEGGTVLVRRDTLPTLRASEVAWRDSKEQREEVAEEK